MKEIVVISGKSGSGKTTVAASLTTLAESKVIADCDIEADNLHLLLKAANPEEHEFRGGRLAIIDEERCIQCGLCQDICRLGAVDSIRNCRIIPIYCNGCGFCYHNCPEEAITLREETSGQWFVAETGYGPLIHARLSTAQENSGRLAAIVKEQAKQIAAKQGREYIINNGPPGNGTPAISAITGANLALIVTEPTPPGINGLERVTNLCQQFEIPAIVCLNKYDLNQDNTRQIEDHCRRQGIEIAARIPFDTTIATTAAKGLPVTEYDPLKALWAYIVKMR